jgi:hypothetical protein
MNCAECIESFELIELPFGSSINAIKSARKTWHKNLHPDVWQNKPGWKGAASQLTNVNLAIDHLLACDGISSEQPAAAADTADTERQQAQAAMEKEYLETMQYAIDHIMANIASQQPGPIVRGIHRMLWWFTGLFLASIVLGIVYAVVNHAFGLSFAGLLAIIAGSIFLCISAVVIRIQWTTVEPVEPFEGRRPAPG